jgi:hypothetical protein
MRPVDEIGPDRSRAEILVSASNEAGEGRDAGAAAEAHEGGGMFWGPVAA